MPVLDKKVIIVEEKLQEMFADLPPMDYNLGNLPSNSTDGFKPVFGFGDFVELNAFLKNENIAKPPYPLIWLIYPYAERHTRNGVNVTGMELILAVNTTTNMDNRERILTTYGKILMPLLANIVHLFEKANIVNNSKEYDVEKYPNYSAVTDGVQHAGTLIWDALKVSFDVELIDTCYRKVRFD